MALEAKSDMLNNLPLILDDTSKVSAKIRDNFEGIVYDLCSGKGKSRSNKELGVNRENRWQNCILTKVSVHLPDMSVRAEQLTELLRSSVLKRYSMIHSLPQIPLKRTTAMQESIL